MDSIKVNFLVSLFCSIDPIVDRERERERKREREREKEREIYNLKENISKDYSITTIYSRFTLSHSL